MDIKELEKFVEEIVEKLEKSEEGLSPEEESKIRREVNKYFTLFEITKFGKKRNICIDDNEKLMIEQLKLKLDVAISMARSKYQSKSRRDIVTGIKYISIAISSIICGLIIKTIRII